MHPAGSVIIFTTLSGMGFGLMIVLGADIVPLHRGFMPAIFVAIALACGGLIASTFHLGNPQRAWRAFSQWRSSWLSREGLLSVATLLLFATYAYTGIFANGPAQMLGYLAAIVSAATVFATAMIYAQLKTVPRWHTFLTPLCYLLFALAGGLLWALLLGSVAGDELPWSWFAALLALGAAWCAKIIWWARADRMGLAAAGSTPETATGLKGKVNLLEAPHTAPNYLMKEMVFRIGRKHVHKLRIISLLLGGLLPGVCLYLVGAMDSGTVLPLIAVLSHLVGVFAERWLFFAEAEHVVSLYYGHR